MRKELLVYVNTGEANEEISVTSVAKHRSLVLITTSTGTKFTANREELLEALQAIATFDSSVTTKPEPIDNLNTLEVSYGDEQ
jgi:hypothetical protein